MQPLSHFEFAGKLYILAIDGLYVLENNKLIKIKAVEK